MAKPDPSRLLRATGPVRTLTGKHLDTVAFPLGGLGTGTVSLGGRGNLRDWEIFNNPGKGRDVTPAFFALWCKPAGGKATARVLEREPLPPFMDRMTYAGGHGLRRSGLPGLPRFREITFRGEYPFARLKMKDPAIPLGVELEAFNPMVPMDETASGIPTAIFRWTFRNRTKRRIELSLAAVLRNPIGLKPGPGPAACVNEFRQSAGLNGLFMSNAKAAVTDPNFGTVALTTTHEKLDVQTHWHPSADWCDDAHMFWNEFGETGRVQNRRRKAAHPEGAAEIADLVLRATLAPGESITIPIILAWHFPNRLRREHWWRLPKDDPTILTNWYATQWKDAWAVAEHVAENLPSLRDRTRAFHKALFTTTLPPFVLDAVSSQMSIPRTATCLRLADGSFHGFEGCNDAAGSCPMNCTHVWNYAQSAAFLFPAMERRVRETDFLHNTRKIGKVGAMAFRTLLPVGSGAPLPMPDDYDAANDVLEMLPAADGQMGTIVRAYREYKLCGDRDWLSKLWPDVVRALEFAWLGEDGKGKNAWDPKQTGVLRGRQHNTYDIEFFGETAMTTVLYLAALRAGEEMAIAMDEPTRAKRYRRIFEKGRKWVDENLWSRDYYDQKIRLPRGMKIDPKLLGPDGTPKYQINTGCLADQLMGQFLAHVCDLGHLLSPRKVATAMGSIFRYCFRRRLGDHANVQRVYGCGDEAGLLLCAWPRGGRPQIPFVYCDEVWTGIEYQVAAGLIWEGRIDEGLTIVKAVRQRHAGHNRNPFNEVECGHHYVRAMSSWALLPALSGFRCDAAAAELGFAPKLNERDFRCFFSSGLAWGTFRQNFRRGELVARIRIEHGAQPLATLSLHMPNGKRPTSVNVTGVRGSAKLVAGKRKREDVQIRFEPPIEIAAGRTLTVRLR